MTSFGIEDINFLAGISKDCPSYDLSDKITFYETRPSGYKLSESSTKGNSSDDEDDEERTTYFHCSLIVDKSEPEAIEEDEQEEGEVDIE